MRRSPLKRTGRLRPRSAARTVENEDYRDVKLALNARSRGHCEVVTLWPEVVCAGPVDCHHIRGRKSREERLALDGLINVCRAHHNAIHNYPRLARTLGLLQ